jgi:hypothetical protein
MESAINLHAHPQHLRNSVHSNDDGNTVPAYSVPAVPLTIVQQYNKPIPGIVPTHIYFQFFAYSTAKRFLIFFFQPAAPKQ